MEEKERKELLEIIKTRVSVWEEKTYETIGHGVSVELINGNRFDLEDLHIKQNDVYEDVMVSLYDDLIGHTECHLQHLTDESLEKVAQELPLTHTIFVTAHTDGDKESFCICSVPVACTFQTIEDLEGWLKENFPALDWEENDFSFVCYTEFDNHTGPYLVATLVDSE